MPAEPAVQTTLTCPVCGASEKNLFFPAFYRFENQSYDLVKCAGCSLIHVRPMPTDDVIASMYSDQYFQKDFISGRFEGSYEEILKKRRPEIQGILTRMERFIPSGKRSLFEAGAAGGAFLKCAKDQGWDVRGLEFSAWGTKHANEIYGIPVEQGNFLHTSFPAGKIPVLFFGDVFEHFTDPLLAIRKTHQALIEDGYVVMLLPMYLSSWTFRLLMALRSVLRPLKLPTAFKRLLKLEADTEFNPPYHVYEYSPATISRFLTENGFQVLSINGDLPVPESLTTPPAGERLGSRVLRTLTVAFYRLIKFSSEQFNFPIVRAMVIAKKTDKRLKKEL